MALPDQWANPNATRSRVAIEIAAELVGRSDQRLNQAKVLLRRGNDEPWSTALFGSATMEGIDDVVAGHSALAMINPSTALRMAYLGTGPFVFPQPVRLLAVIPSADQLMFAVRSETGLTSFEDIGKRRFPFPACQGAGKSVARGPRSVRRPSKKPLTFGRRLAGGARMLSSRMAHHASVPKLRRFACWERLARLAVGEFGRTIRIGAARAGRVKWMR
jgi:hypothetical protein